jgi:GMP synthase-like glutamine amidotransferase
MKICILDNDNLDAHTAPTFHSFARMFIQLFERAGVQWEFDAFNTTRGEYPASFEPYDAVLLTGSGADSFSSEPWVVELRSRVTVMVQQRKKMVGVCFGHQLIALCMGARVGRAPQGWGTGRQTYQWHRPELATEGIGQEISLLASHQDQVFELPVGARLVASSAYCPVAAFTVDDCIFCIQPHPEFVEDFSAYLLDKRRSLLGEEQYGQTRASLQLGHDGDQIARLLVSFLQGTPA